VAEFVFNYIPLENLKMLLKVLSPITVNTLKVANYLGGLV
jgi:hypothetical protein